MQTRFLKSTTAIMLALSVAMPAPLVAQDTSVKTELEKSEKKLKEELKKAEEKAKGKKDDKAEDADVEAKADGDGSIKPKDESAEAGARDEMKPDNGKAAEAKGNGKAKGKDAAQASAEPAANGKAKGKDKAEAAAEPAPAADANATVQTDSDTKAKTDTEQTAAGADAKIEGSASGSAEATATPAADAPASDAATADAGAADKVKKKLKAAEDKAEKTGDTAAAATDTAKDQTGGTTSAETTAQSTAQSGASVDATATTKPAAEASAAPKAEGSADTTADSTAAADGSATTKTDGSASAGADTTQTVTSDGSASAGTDTTQTVTSDGSGSAGTDTTQTATTDGSATTEQSAEQQATAKAATDQPKAETGEPPKAMAANADKGEGKLIEEKVTDQNARSSDEEFKTTVEGSGQGGAPAPSTTAAASATEDEGMSTAEKIALFGLGALAVGALLNNGQKVVSNSGDRVVIDDNGTYRVLKNDDTLLRQPGSDVKTYAFNDGSTRTVVTNPDGSQVETIRAANGRVLSRTRILPNGQQVVLFDDTRPTQQVEVSELPEPTTSSRSVDADTANEEALRNALRASLVRDPGRNFSLAQIRNISQVRELAPEIEVDNINFETGSAVIRPREAEELASLGEAMREMIRENPGEVFLVEGHTDAVGDAGYNLALSDRRAESLALALTEYFNVPPESMIVQGYGESDLKVQTSGAERLNRRAAVRRITPLLKGTAS